VNELLDKYESTLLYVINRLSTPRAGQDANQAAAELYNLLEELEELEGKEKPPTGRGLD
jgi:hypothetical protein